VEILLSKIGQQDADMMTAAGGDWDCID